MISIVVPMVQTTESLKKNLCRLEGHSKVLEIILVDNARKNLRSYIPKSSKVKYIKSDRLRNRSYARNLGAFTAKGEIILFADQEVSVPVEFLEEAECFDSTDFDVVIPKVRPVYSREGVAQRTYSEKYAQVSRESFCTFSRFDLSLPNLDSACFMVRKKFFNKTGGFDPKFIRFEDRHWGRLAILNGANFKCVPVLCDKDIQDLNLISYCIKNFIDVFFRTLSNRLLSVNKNLNKGFLYWFSFLYPVSRKKLEHPVKKLYSFHLGKEQLICTGNLSYIYNERKIKLLNSQNLKFTVLSELESNEFLNLDSNDYFLVLKIAKKLKNIGINIEKRGPSEQST